MGIFEPYRAIGYITSEVPFSVQRLGTETFVTVSVGKAWQVYDCAKLTLAMVGPQLPKKIRALASYRDYTFAAFGTEIGVFKRSHQVATWSRHKEKVNILLLFGEHVLSVDIKGNLFIWAFKGVEQNLEPVRHIVLEENFSPSCIMHPDTYLNKVIVGSQEGSLQLWNISTRKRLYEFKGWNSSIYCCVSSPALDVVAVGCADGTIHIHNARYDEEIVSFTHSTRGAVTALSFSTDGQPLLPLLASGDSSGFICIWNLEKQKLQSVIREAHDSSIVSLHFFANEPVLMSSAADNSVKMWIFDTTDGDARLLRFRSGHSAPPLCIRNGRCILSTGQDRTFRLFSVIQVRNKPIEPPKKPEKAPFFLPSTPSLSGEILFKPNAVADGDEKDAKVQDLTRSNQKMNLTSQFSLLLQSCAANRDFSTFTDYIKGLSPSTLDVELCMLQIIDEEDVQTLDQRPEPQTIGLLLDYLIHDLSCKNNFEFIQAVIKLFLKIHGERVRMHPSLQEKTKMLLEVQSSVWNRVDQMFQSARCMVTFLSNSQF